MSEYAFLLISSLSNPYDVHSTHTDRFYSHIKIFLVNTCNNNIFTMTTNLMTFFAFPTRGILSDQGLRC